jgi:hypothetical protein
MAEPVAVDPQVRARQAADAVYCSCRCDGPDAKARYCECPSGFACEKLVGQNSRLYPDRPFPVVMPAAFEKTLTFDAVVWNAPNDPRYGTPVLLAYGVNRSIDA